MRCDECLQARRSAARHRRTDKLARLPIPLPPLAEQKRIVAKVDELMALCDRLEAQQQERETRHAALARASLARFADAPTPANLKFLFHTSYAIPPADLRKSILTLAVQGKLVPQDPNDEPAASLIRAPDNCDRLHKSAKRRAPTSSLTRSRPTAYGLGSHCNHRIGIPRLGATTRIHDQTRDLLNGIFRFSKTKATFQTMKIDDVTTEDVCA